MSIRFLKFVGKGTPCLPDKLILKSVEFAHQKADKHLCVELHGKERIRLYPSTESFCGLCRHVNQLMAYPNERIGHHEWILNLSLFYHNFFHSTIIQYHNIQSLLQFLQIFAIGRVDAYVRLCLHQSFYDF